MGDLVAAAKAFVEICTLVRLVIKHVKEANKEQETQLTVKQGVATINDAFKTKDPTKLNALFNDIKLPQ